MAGDRAGDSSGHAKPVQDSIQTETSTRVATHETAADRVQPLLLLRPRFLVAVAAIAVAIEEKSGYEDQRNFPIWDS